jgi:hypothetical protein
MLTDPSFLLRFLSEHELTLSQFMLCYTLHRDRRDRGDGPLQDSGPNTAWIYQYVEAVGPWPSAVIQDLVAKNFLTDRNVGSAIYPDQLQVTSKFTDALFVGTPEFQAFWNAYPNNVHTEEGPRSLKNVDARQTQERFRTCVETKPEANRLHDALAWARKHDLIRVSIDRYLETALWRQHLELKRRWDESRDIAQDGARSLSMDDREDS